MTPTQIYKQLDYHQLDEDVRQELAIKIWLSIDSFNPEVATFATWVSAIVKNYKISNSRSKKQKENDLTNPLSYFDVEKEGHTNNPIVDSLTSEELSAIDCMIQLEEREVLLNRLKTLPDALKKTAMDVINGTYEGGPTERVNLHRAIEYLREDKCAASTYILENTITGESFECQTLNEAADICDFTPEGLRYAVNNSGLFKKKVWKISRK